MSDNVPKLGGLKKLGKTTENELPIEPQPVSERSSSIDAPPILSVNSSDAPTLSVRQQTLDESAHQAMDDSHHATGVLSHEAVDLDQTFDDFAAPSLASLSSGEPASVATPVVAEVPVIEPPKEKKSKLKLGKKSAAVSPVAVAETATPAAPVNPCVACGLDRTPGAIFCLSCGYNEETGKKVNAQMGPSSLGVKKSAKQVAQEKPIKKAPNYQLLAAYRFVISALACAAAVFYAPAELWQRLYGFSEEALKTALTDAQFSIVQGYFDLSLVAAGAAAAWAGSLLSNLFLKSPYKSYLTAVFVSFVVISISAIAVMFTTIKAQDKKLNSYCGIYLEKTFASGIAEQWVSGPEPKKDKEFDCPSHFSGTISYTGIDGAVAKKKAWQARCDKHAHLVDNSLELTKKGVKRKFQEQFLNVYQNLDFWRQKAFDKLDSSTD